MLNDHITNDVPDKCKLLARNLGCFILHLFLRLSRSTFIQKCIYNQLRCEWSWMMVGYKLQFTKAFEWLSTRLSNRNCARMGSWNRYLVGWTVAWHNVCPPTGVTMQTLSPTVWCHQRISIWVLTCFILFINNLVTFSGINSLIIVDKQLISFWNLFGRYICL